MAISSTGIISGLDVNTIISASMKLEELPLNRLKNKLTSTESQISAMGKVKSTIATLQEAAKALSNSEDLRASKSTLSNADLGSATATGKATPGTYKIDVTQLATNHKMVSDPASAINVPSTGGFVSIALGSGSAVNIDIAAGASLSSIASSINEANAGVSATVVNGDGGQQLVLTSKEAGSAHAMSINSNIGLVFDSTKEVAAQDAKLKIDGVEVTRSSNTIDDAVAGVTLNLKATGTSQLSIERDDSALETKVKAFVDAYNNARSTMKSLSQYDTDGKGKNSGVLNGNGTVNSVMSELRGLLSQKNGVSDAYPNLSTLGIKTNAVSGALEFDSAKFNAAAKADFSAMSKTVSAFATAFDTATTRMNSTDGMITRQVDGLGATKSRINDGISAQERRLEIVQKRYEKQFANLETLLSSMQKTGNQLSQQLASLSKSS